MSSYSEFVEAIATLADQEQLLARVKRAAKGALVCGGMSFLGELCLGPLGMAMGGISGAIIAAYMAQGKSRPVGDIIRNDLTKSQQEQLVLRILGSLVGFDVTTVKAFKFLLSKNSSVQQQVSKGLKAFIAEVMNLEVDG
ncbi:protein C19orf12 homolog [Hermetia illucens]|nr:protein C19orf12 homolog [Hermetia illucens]